MLWAAPGLSEGDHCAVDLIDQLPACGATGYVRFEPI